MTTNPSSPNSVATANSTPSFAQRNWQHIVWLVAAIIGIIVIGYVVSLFVQPKVLSQDVQANLMGVFLVVYIVGLVRSQFIYRIRGATYSSLYSDEENRKRRIRNENRNSSSLNLSIYGSSFLSAIGSWIFSQLFWFFISGVTWPFIEAFTQVLYLISSDARRADDK